MAFWMMLSYLYSYSELVVATCRVKCLLVIKFWWTVRNASIPGEQSSSQVKCALALQVWPVAHSFGRHSVSMTSMEHKGIGTEGRYQWHWVFSISRGLPSVGKSWGNPKSFINTRIKAKARKSFPKWEMPILCRGSQTKPFLVRYQMTKDAAALLLDACTKQAKRNSCYTCHT